VFATPATYASAPDGVAFACRGIAAILAGVLIFAGIVGELAFGHEPDLLEAVDVSLACSASSTASART
jgi:hypothetical protein